MKEADLVHFPEEEREARMEAALLGWVGRPCTFVREGRKLRGKVAGGRFLGMRDEVSQFEVLVQGTSGKLTKVDLREEELVVW